MCSRSLDSILKPYETCLSEEGLRRGKVEGDTGKKKKKRKKKRKKKVEKEKTVVWVYYMREEYKFNKRNRNNKDLKK